MIARMRKPSTDSRIVANSLSEIVNGLEDVMIGLGRGGTKGPFRALAQSNVFNALACWFLAQSAAHQKSIVLAGLKLYETALNSDDEVRFDVLGADSEPKYTGSAPSRVRSKKPRGSDEAVG